MSSTLLLDTVAWDLVLDVKGNIAVASEPYALAQDAASAIRTFQGECFWDETVGLPYMTQVLGRTPSLALFKQLAVDQALTVPGVKSAQCFVAEVNDRGIAGQIQVTADDGATQAATFAAINPQTGA